MTAKEKIIQELDEVQKNNGHVNWWTVLDVVEGYEEQLIDENYSPQAMVQVMLDMYVN
jgi:hypothetical protein